MRIDTSQPSIIDHRKGSKEISLGLGEHKGVSAIVFGKERSCVEGFDFFKID